MQSIRYQTLAGQSGGYWVLLALLVVLTAIGYAAAHHMEVNGHYVTGMNNQIVWGMPHVFAVFLIVAASGALNTASISSVFGKYDYKPLARLSGLLSVALLLGGLIVLVLDLGRPDRLIVAMTYYNFKSIFAWNIFLYIGFLIVVAIYLWMMFEPRMNKFGKTAGVVAFIWRFVLTTGTGSIFGFLVARQAYDAAIMAPLFIIMSLSFGTAIFLLVLLAAFKWSDRPLDEDLVRRLKNLTAIFVSAVLYMTLAYHLTNLYATEHHGIERFILLDGGINTLIFWLFQIFLGSVVPLIIFFTPTLSRSQSLLVTGLILVVVGGLAQVYVIIIGAQAYPLMLFPGMEASSSFYDGVVNEYIPSLPEILLGLGGIGLSLLIAVLAMRVLPFLPERLGSLDGKIAEPEATGTTG